MNLKKRLALANSAAVIIPVMITAILALALYFICGQWIATDLSSANYQKLSHIKLELLSIQNMIVQQKPEAVEEKGFQKDLQERLAGIDGELVIVKNDDVIYASRNLTKIELAKCLAAAGGLRERKDPVVIGDALYSVQAVDLKMQDGSQDRVLLLAPVDQAFSTLWWFLGGAVFLFVIFFVVTNMTISYQLSRSILTPLHNLQKAAAEISRGNLDYQIIEEGDAEIQALCRDLEIMRIKLKDSIHTQLKYEENRKMLISSISHDLKTPVTSIKGYVEGILDGIANTQEKKERYLKTIYTKTQQIDQMIDDLLLYAKLDVNKIPYNFERTDIEEYLKECLLESEPELERNRIKIVMQSDLRHKHKVLIDRERMKRVIINILDNSRKHLNKEQGEIKILLRATNSSIIIEVNDNGSGIRERDLPHIFDRFFRADAAAGIEGSGLGLAIAKQIVEGHNGRIWAVSQGDQGTSIIISLNDPGIGERNEKHTDY